ncbi:putative glycolipid-binding domain-containing protein [soil metagenome]
MSYARMLLWSIDEIAGFDVAWVTIDGERLTAEGQQSGLMPMPYWVRYRLETTERFVTTRMTVESRWETGEATLDLRRDDGGWTVDGESRPDLDQAFDLDLAGCPLTNTMPILRHGLHVHHGGRDLLMAFIEVPSLRVVPSRQRYTHVRALGGGSSIIRYRSGSFQSDLTIDANGFVVDYPQLGSRLVPQSSESSVRAAGPGTVRPE